MRTSIKGLLAAAAFTVIAATSATAASVALSFQEGTIHETLVGVRDVTSTYGNDVVGATVMVDYVDGGSETFTWAVIVDYLGGVESANLSLSTNGWDGFLLTSNRLLASISIDLAPASSLFDAGTAYEWEDGNTITTHVGFPYSTLGGDILTGEIAVSYSNAIRLVGTEVMGDAFTTMTVDYTGLTGGGFLGSTLFTTDMDTLEVAGDLSPVPLPASIAFLLGGLGLLGVHRVKRS